MAERRPEFLSGCWCLCLVTWSLRSARLASWESSSKAQVSISDSGLPSIPEFVPCLSLLNSILAEGWISFQVLLYNGQLDIIVAAVLTERSLMAMEWKGLQEYKKATRKVWKVFKSDTDVAGYVRQVDTFHQVRKHWRHKGHGSGLVGLNIKHKNHKDMAVLRQNI